MRRLWIRQGLPLCLLLLLFPQPTKAATVVIPYQGYLTDASDTPVSGMVFVIVRLYTSQFGGSPMYQAPFSPQPMNGYFTLSIGTGVSLDEQLFASGDTFIQFEVGALTLFPRLLFSPTHPAQGLSSGDGLKLLSGVSVPLVARAGEDKTVNEGTAVVLDGTMSTGAGLTFAWEQVAGPVVSISGSTSTTPTFMAPPLPGGFGSQTLTFQLTVRSGADSSTDTVNVTVVNVNHAPTADAGADQVVNEGSPVTLDGSHSFDPDGDSLAYVWVQTGGPSVTLNGATTAGPMFTAPLLVGGVGGPLVLEVALTVSDGALSSVVRTRVAVEQVNHAPVADAGVAQTVHSGKLVMLDGSHSLDPDSDPLSFVWTQIGGPIVSLTDPTTVSPTFTAPPVNGTTNLTFRLSVTDGVMTSAPADVVITVKNGVPLCALARAVPKQLWPPDHRLIAVGIAGVTDPDDDTISITITGVTQDEPVNGLGDGDTSPDALILGSAVLLRAERSGMGNGRVYQVRFTAGDSEGASCVGSVIVGVPKSMKPGGTAFDDGQQFDATQP